MGVQTSREAGFLLAPANIVTRGYNQVRAIQKKTSV
jgi:hypothetical protein